MRKIPSVRRMIHVRNSILKCASHHLSKKTKKISRNKLKTFEKKPFIQPPIEQFAVIFAKNAAFQNLNLFFRGGQLQGFSIVRRWLAHFFHQNNKVI